MKLLFCSSCIPSEKISNATQSAVNIQSYYTLINLIQNGCEIDLQIIFDDNRENQNLEPYEKKLIKILKKKKINVLNPIFLSKVDLVKNKVPKFLVKFIKKNVIFKTYKLFFKRAFFLKKLDIKDYDRIFLYLCPESTALFYGSKVKKISFEGDFHYQSFETNIKKNNFSSFNFIILFIINYLTLFFWKIIYVKILMDYNKVLFASYNIFNKFKLKISNSFFVGTLWPNNERFQIKRGKKKKVKVILHIGNFNNTAGGNALRYIYEKLSNLIYQKVNREKVDFFIIGAGKLEKNMEKKFLNLGFIIKSWVKDLDQEMINCDIFVFLNNAGPLKAIFSRQIYAWSLGLCVLAHSDSLNTVKQMKNNFNIIVGSNEFEIIEKLNYLIESKNERKRIGRNALSTFTKNFSPQMHTKKILSYLN